MIEFKQNVDVKDVKSQIISAMSKTAMVYMIFGKQLVITSVNDSVHMKGSKHYTGEAFDTRTFYFTDEEIPRVLTCLKSALGKDFDIIFEKDHFHIEYDPK